ncbi:MAG: 2OG-Fe(II) oxygenase [Rhodospirillales bacterium]
MTLNKDKPLNNPASGLAALEPSPHFMVSNFLGKDLVERLLHYCVDNEARFVATSVGNGQTAKLDYQLRRSRSLVQADQFTNAVQQAFQARLAALLPTITAALKLSPFAPTKYEMELAAHNDGAFFGKHIDTFIGNADLPAQRMVTAVYYFFVQPKPFSGGALRLYPLLDASDSGRFLDIEPVNDSLICFPSFAPHAVQPIACSSGLFVDSRFAVNNWICRDTPSATRSN